jgi:hypothetical protein
MAVFDEDRVFVEEQIRDIVTHNSVVSPSAEFRAKTIFIANGLDQAVTLQLRGARDGIFVNVGDPFIIAANSNGYQTVEDYFPKYDLTAQCSIAPISGALNVWIIKR